MPEGPEVKILVDNLNKKFKNKILEDVTIVGGRYTKKKPDGYDNFVKSLPLQVCGVFCKGKFIYITFKKSEHVIFNTLGLKGYWSNKKDKHSALHFNFGNFEYYFEDSMHYGTIKFVDTTEELDKKLNTLGPDILQEDISIKEFKVIMRKNDKKNIVQVLTNQKVISGIGNYLVAEILYMAKISPKRDIVNISDNELMTILNAAKYLTNLSYNDYNNFDFKVYRQDMDQYGNKVETYKRKDGRTTHWVPKVQK